MAGLEAEFAKMSDYVVVMTAVGKHNIAGYLLSYKPSLLSINPVSKNQTKTKDVVSNIGTFSQATWSVLVEALALNYNIP